MAHQTPDSQPAEPDRKWQRCADVFERYSARSLLLLAREGEALKLNESAALIWALLDDMATESALVDALAVHFSVGCDVVRGTTRETLNLLQAHHLIIQVDR